VRRECEGYADGSAGKRRSRKAKPPAAGVQQKATLLPKDASGLQPLGISPSNSSFSSDLEALCFRHFCDRTSTFLAGPFESNLWTRLIPQECRGNSSVRHAVISIAALSLIPGIVSSSSDEQAESYHRFALQQYGRAVQEMRDSTAIGTHRTRSILLSCLVIICFEAFYGNHESALKQLRTGLNLINTWAETKGPGGCHNSTTLVLAASDFLETELIQAFARLELHVIMIMKSRRGSSQYHVTMTDMVLPGVSLMPSSFSSVEEATMHLGSIIRRFLMLLNSDKEDIILSCRHLSSSILEHIPSTYLAERERLLDMLIQWHSAFDPIIQRVRRTANDTDCRAVLIMHLQYLTTYFAISSLPNKSPQRRRDYMPLFSEMLSLSRSILQHPDTVTNIFTFNAQTIKPLFTVACQCPNSTLRRQAISMLLAAPRREVFWDAILCGKLAQWIMTIEEEELDGDYVPDETMIQSLSVTADLQQRRVEAECWKSSKDSAGQLMSRSAIITW
jgi:hypothetical protein